MLGEGGKNILSKISLKFCNQRIETDFSKKTRENNRSHNIWISFICSILSFAMTILYMTQFYQIKERGRTNNLEIEKVTNSTLIQLILSNKSSISSNYYSPTCTHEYAPYKLGHKI